MQAQRVQSLDSFRGWAILLMVLYHFVYDLNHFHFITVDLNHDSFWVYARYVIVSMFLLAVGISLALVHAPHIKWEKMKKRTLILGLASLLVSIATYLQFPNSWVYFGILHFILFASWVALLFISFPTLTYLAIVTIPLGSYMGWLQTHSLFTYLQPILHLPAQYTEDLVIFFPWFTLVLLGVALVQQEKHQVLLDSIAFSKETKPHQFLSFLGRHTLIIYLIHQPILFGLVSLFKH